LFYFEPKALELLHISKADNKKSTPEGLFYPRNNQISWFCEKQNCVSQSTVEAEYTAAGSSCSKLVWMKEILLKEYNVEQDVPTLCYVYLSTINIPKSTIQYSRTEHIDVKFHSFRDCVENNIVTLEYVGTEEQLEYMWEACVVSFIVAR
jgi:hypothetical protein